MMKIKSTAGLSLEDINDLIADNVVYEITMKDDAVFRQESEEELASVIIKYKPTENSGGDGTTEKELKLNVLNSAYNNNPTAEDLFIAGVVEFALILRNSEYKADANLEELITTLNSLDLTANEFKAEFRDLVIKYASK